MSAIAASIGMTRSPQKRTGRLVVNQTLLFEEAREGADVFEPLAFRIRPWDLDEYAGERRRPLR